MKGSIGRFTSKIVSRIIIIASRVWIIDEPEIFHILLEVPTAGACFIFRGARELSRFFGFLITRLVRSLPDSVTDIRRQPISRHDVPFNGCHLLDGSFTPTTIKRKEI